MQLRREKNSETHHVIVDLEIHFTSLKYMPRHAEVDAWIGKNALLVAFGCRDQLVKPFKVFYICRFGHEEYLVYDTAILLEISLRTGQQPVSPRRCSHDMVYLQIAIEDLDA